MTWFRHFLRHWSRILIWCPVWVLLSILDIVRNVICAVLVFGILGMVTIYALIGFGILAMREVKIPNWVDVCGDYLMEQITFKWNKRVWVWFDRNWLPLPEYETKG